MPDPDRRDKVVRAEMSEDEKSEWEEYLASIPGAETTHREGMLRAKKAADYLNREFPDMFEEAFGRA